MGKRSGAQLNEPRYSQSLETGLLMMRGFSAEDAMQGIADVADRMEASRSTVHRYMTTLVALGMLEQDPQSRRYRVSLLPSDLGAAALGANRVVKAIGDSLTPLRRQSGCTVWVTVPSGLDALIVGHERSWAQGQGMLGVQVRRGARVPGYCTAVGKVLLGAVDPKQLREELGSLTPVKRASKTLTAKRAIATAAAEAAEAGIAREREEWQDGVLGIAVPVLDGDEEVVAALGLVGCVPEVTMGGLEAHLQAMRDVASEIGSRVAPAPFTRAFKV